MSRMDALLAEVMSRQFDLLKAWSVLQSVTPPAPPRDLLGKAPATGQAWHRAAAAYTERYALFSAAQDAVRIEEVRERIGA